MTPGILNDAPERVIETYRNLLAINARPTPPDIRVPIKHGDRARFGDHGLWVIGDLLVAAIASRIADEADAGLIGKGTPVGDFLLDEEFADRLRRVRTEARRQLTMRFQIHLQERATEGRLRVWGGRDDRTGQVHMGMDLPEDADADEFPF